MRRRRRPAADRPRAGSARAFTLFETLIVIAILVAIGAITVPLVLTRGGETELRDRAETVRWALAGARAEAVESGAAVEIFARERADGSTELVSTRRQTEAPEQSNDASAPTRVLIALRPGLTIEAPVTVGADDEEASERPALAVFLPDGGAVAPAPIVIRGRAGRVGVSVSRLTGRALVVDAPIEDVEAGADSEPVE